ncbi:MAG: fluoride efflux transporter CrcB [Phycisphaerae bacterium]|nr:fluoride efflux transporter CrcB [Phycisphaerae bacterium]NUQ47970.1 fluoride efflux transporter CrcB [Phycisphaerae bacterium]
MLKYALIVAGGGMGSLLRYLVQGWGQNLVKGAFPLGTLLVNVAGCFAIGFLNTAFIGPLNIRMEYRQGLLIGLLGGFTTFSAFGWETFSLANDRQLWRAFANVMLSLGLGLIAVWAGSRMAEKAYGV